MVKTTYLVALAGALWTFVGMALFILGISLVKESSLFFPLLFLGIFVGLLKASSVLKKTAEKTALRLLDKEEGSFFHLFNFRYLLLIGIMMGLGMLMRFFGTSPVVRGTIDMAVGTALFTASFYYFRYLW